MKRKEEDTGVKMEFFWHLKSFELRNRLQVLLLILSEFKRVN